jgi:hypothetical protein
MLLLIYCSIHLYSIEGVIKPEKRLESLRLHIKAADDLALAAFYLSDRAVTGR